MISEDCQGVCHGNAVVAAQGGAVGPDVLAVGAEIKTVLREINGTVLGLFSDHIHVALENNGGMMLVTDGAVLVNDDVVGLVLIILQAVVLGEADQPVADLLRVGGAVWDGAELFKIIHRPFGLDSFQNTLFHEMPPVIWYFCHYIRFFLKCPHSR